MRSSLRGFDQMMSALLWGALCVPTLGCVGCTTVELEPRVEVECSSVSPGAISLCVDQERFSADVGAVAGPDRMTGGAHWQTVQDLCFDRLTELGFDTVRHTYPMGEGVNVIGVKRGSERPDEEVVVAAHYDAIDPACTGADDNATGVAGVLEVARVLADVPFPRTLVAACWDEHEVVERAGSRAWVAERATDGAQFPMTFTFEMIGYTDKRPNTQATQGIDFAFPAEFNKIKADKFRGDFIALVFNNDVLELATTYAQHLGTHGVDVVRLGIPDDDLFLEQYKNLRRSDHASFWQHGHHGAMVTDTGNFRNPFYHCENGDDGLSTLDMDFAINVVRGTTATVAHALYAR